MKIAGWIIIVFGTLGFIGCLAGGNNSIIGPLFWIVLGIYLLRRASQKQQEKEDKDRWNNQ